MLELDLILNRFIKDSLDNLQDKQVQAFERLLSFSDPEVYALLMGIETAADKEIAEIVSLVSYKMPN